MKRKQFIILPISKLLTVKKKNAVEHLEKQSCLTIRLQSQILKNQQESFVIWYFRRRGDSSATNSTWKREESAKIYWYIIKLII